MSKTSSKTFGSLAALCLVGLGSIAAKQPEPKPDPTPLTGAWILVAADIEHADGTRGHDYGEAPKGLMLIEAQGHYSLQIFKSERPRFASADKAKGTPAEYEAAVMGSSTHFGTAVVDTENHVLTLNIEASSFPNLEGTSQKRPYQIIGDELTYRVQKRPNGDTPISVWRRIK